MDPDLFQLRTGTCVYLVVGFEEFKRGTGGVSDDNDDHHHVVGNCNLLFCYVLIRGFNYSFGI